MDVAKPKDEDVAAEVRSTIYCYQLCNTNMVSYGIQSPQFAHTIYFTLALESETPSENTWELKAQNTMYKMFQVHRLSPLWGHKLVNSLKAYHQLPGLDIFVFIYVVPQLAVTTDHGSILECGMGCNGYTCYYKIQIRKCQANVFKTCGHKRQMPVNVYNL